MLDKTTQVVAPARTSAAPAAPASPSTSPAFQALLERLEKVQAPAAADVHDAKDLQKAMQTAANGFGETMELRRALEAAFRARST
jgi:hypothetical protein